MSLLYFDSIQGASGDMILAVLLDLGVARDELAQALAGLPVEPFEIREEAVTEQGIRGRRVRIILASDPDPDHDHAQNHDAYHTHGHAHASGPQQGQDHTQGQAQGHGHSHTPTPHKHAPHRGLRDIKAILEASALPASVKIRSQAVFQRLAEVEAKVHGVTTDQIHFHEVGAVDSIVDIVGSCWCLHRLGIRDVAVGAIPVGHGVITCAHGVMPNPAPATLELTRGLPLVSVDEPFELVTPTAAALLSVWKNVSRPPAGSTVTHIGYGVGHRRLQKHPNLLRACVMELAVADGDQDRCVVLETNIDDTTPHVLAAAFQRLMEGGALDVWMTPIQMKKQRAAVTMSVLCHPDQAEACRNLLFRETPTFGIREYDVRRTMLARRFETVPTAYGPVRVKIGNWRGQDVTRSPEYADCQAAAQMHQVPFRQVYDAVAWTGGGARLHHQISSSHYDSEPPKGGTPNPEKLPKIR